MTRDSNEQTDLPTPEEGEADMILGDQTHSTPACLGDGAFRVPFGPRKIFSSIKLEVLCGYSTGHSPLPQAAPDSLSRFSPLRHHCVEYRSKTMSEALDLPPYFMLAGHSPLKHLLAFLS